MAQGGFGVSLDKSITPNSVVNTIDAWGHIVIVPADLNPQEYSDSTLLNAAAYVGIVESLELGLDEDVLIQGTGLVSYLGDGDTRGMPISESGGPSGVRSYKNKTLEDTLDSTGTPKGLLRQEDGSQGPIRKGTITEPTDSGTYTGKHYTESALKAIKFVCQELDVEFKIDTQGFLSAGPKENLFTGHTTDPTAIIVRDGEGQDPNIDGIATTSLIAQFNAAEFVSKVELIASKHGKEANIGSASASSVPYKDLFGSDLKRIQYVSDPGTQATSQTQRASAYLNELNLVKKTLNVSLEEYDIDGDFEVGDKVFIFDPDIGFMDTEADRIADGRSSLFETIYQGQVLNPTKIRILGITWPIKEGYGVFYRDKDGNYTELTDYCLWETGDVQLEIGDVAPSMSEQLGFSGYSLDTIGGPDKSIPDQPVNSAGNNGIDTVSGTYSDGNGVSKAFIKVTWNQPTNTDGSTITDGAYYRIRWRVVQDTDGNNIIDSNDTQATEFIYSNVDFDTREFIIYDLSPNTFYSVGVQAIDLSGFTSSYSEVASLQTPSDAGAPNKPDTFATIASNPLRVQFIHNLGQAKDSSGNAVSPVVDFTLAKDISHLNIYASTTSGFDLQYNSTTKKVTQTGFKIGELLASSAHIQNGIAAVGYIDLDNADTHYFRVTAVDTSGNESEPSDEQSGSADLVNSANIANLAVTNALIANAAITDLKVADVSAGKLTAGTISGQTIILDVSGDTGNSSQIKSSNYSTGSTGWAINSDGSAEFRNATIRGSLHAEDIDAGTINAARLDLSGKLSVGDAASDVNSNSTTIDGGKISANSITASQIQSSSITTSELNFTPFADGDSLTSGSVGGISINSNDIQANFTSGSAGFKIESDGDAFFNSVTVNNPVITLSTNTGSGVPTSASSSILKLGTATLFERSNKVFTSKPFVVFPDGDEDNPSLTISGDYDEMGFFVSNSTEFGGFSTFSASNGDDDIFSFNTLSTQFNVKGNLSVEGGTMTVNGDSGGNSQFLGYNSSGTLGFHTITTSSHDHDSSYSATSHDHDSDYYSASAGAVLASSLSSHTGHATSLSLLSNTSTDDSGGLFVTSVSGLGIRRTNIAGTTMDTQKVRPHLSETYALGESGRKWTIVHSQFGVSTSSDQRLKENIEDLNLGLDFINKLQPKKFNWKTETVTLDNGQEIVKREEMKDIDMFGFLAQDLLEIDDLKNDNTYGLVRYFDEQDSYEVNNDNYIAPLVKAVQELSAKNDELETRIAALEG